MTRHEPSVERRDDLHGQSGFVAGAEALLFGCLVFVVGTMLVINAWASWMPGWPPTPSHARWPAPWSRPTRAPDWPSK